MTEDSHTWGLPFASLLGAYAAQMGFGLPSIGGRIPCQEVLMS